MDKLVIKESISNKRINIKSYFNFMLLKFLPIDKYLIDLFLPIELITFAMSESKLLSLKSKPLIHRISAILNSKTVAPFDFRSFELKSTRTSVANSLHANPKSIAFNASDGNLLNERFIVLRPTVDEKNALNDGGTLTSLFFFDVN